MPKIKKTIAECVAMHRAINELQPKSQSIINSDYDMGLKAAYSFNRTADYLETPLKPLQKLEEEFSKKIQELNQSVKDSTKEEREEAQKQLDELQEKFSSDRNEILAIEEEVDVHAIDLADISDKTRTPAYWILDAIRDCFTNKVTSTEVVKMTIKDALEVRKAVQLYLAAPTPWDIENAKSQNPKLDIPADAKYPNDCGWPLASKLFWNSEIIRKSLSEFMDEYDNKIDAIRSTEDKSEGKKKAEEFDLWVSEKLEELVSFEGITTIGINDFPDDLATPSGAVIGGLMPILQED